MDISCNLVYCAKVYGTLLLAVKEHPGLYERGEHAMRAIARYVRFMESPRVADVPVPVDIMWVWCVHCLNPQAYVKDCVSAFGALVPYWASSEKRDVTFAPAFSGEELYDTPSQFRFFPSLDLEAALVRQKGFLFKSGALCNASASTLSGVVGVYESFLGLIKSHPGQSMVPTIAIDMIWHSHMMVPEAYTRDMITNIGYIVNHDDSIPDEDLEESKQATQKAWGDTHDTLYNNNNKMKMEEDNAQCGSCKSGGCSSINKPVESAQCGSCKSGGCSSIHKPVEGAQCGSCKSGGCSSIHKPVDSAQCGNCKSGGCSSIHKPNKSAQCGSCKSGGCSSIHKPADTTAQCGSCKSGGCSSIQKPAVEVLAQCGSCKSGGCTSIQKPAVEILAQCGSCKSGGCSSIHKPTDNAQCGSCKSGGCTSIVHKAPVL